MGGASGQNINILDTNDIWTYRHNPNNEPFVDAMNEGARKIQKDFTDLMDTVQEIHVARLGGADAALILGYYSRGERLVALNGNYTDIDKMNSVYDAATRSGFHPSRGNLSGTEAVALHELGHALTDHIAQKMGVNDLDVAARRIFEGAFRETKGKGRYQDWAGQISGYAKENYAETVAEAVSDYYCNGSKAHPNSIAIMNQLRKYR